MKRQLIINAILNILGTMWGVGTSFLLTPFLVRHLGDEGYGIWVLALSFSMSSGYFALLEVGFLTSVVRFVAKYRALNDAMALNQVFSAAMLLFCCLGGVALVIIVLFATLFLRSTFSIPLAWFSVARSLLYVFSIRTALEFPLMVLTATLQGLQRYDVTRLIELTRLILYAALVVALLGRGHGALTLGWIVLGVMLFQVSASTVLLKHVLPTLRIVPFTRDTVGELVRFSAQIFVLRINAVVYNQMDKVIIGVFLVSTLLTDYDIANKVRAMVLAVISSVSVLAVPAASYLEARDDHDRLRSLFYQGTKYTLMIALPSVVSILILSPSLITLWVGAEYSYLVGLVRLTVVYLSWFPLVVTGYNMLIGTGQIKPLLVVQTITTLINLLVSIWLTPPLGVAGVMWGTLVGNLLAFGPYMVILGRTFAVQWGEFVRTVIVPVYASAILFGTVLLLAVRLWGQPQTFWQLAWLGGVSGGIYVVGLFVLGTSASERKALLEIIAGRLAHQ